MKILLSAPLLLFICGCAAKDAVITNAEFEQVQEGMAYERVATIVGAPGKCNLNQTVLGVPSQMWIWQNKDDTNMVCAFQNGKLINKEGSDLP